MAAACVSGFLAVLTHTVTGAVFGILLTGGLIAAFGGSRRPLLVAACGSAVALGWLVAVVLPALRAKTAMTSWLGLSPAHAAMGVVAQASWPVCALAAAGLPILWHRDRAQAAFWAFAGAVWVGAAVALPKVLVFHTAYTFPLMLPAFVFAALAAEACASAVPSRLGAWAVWLALPLLNLPALASYYQDGNRHDFRAAAAYLVEHVGPNDRVLSNEPDKLLYYRPELRPHVVEQLRTAPPAEAVAKVPPGGRLWVVSSGGRGGFEPAWQAWVYAHCRQQARVERPRYDYYAFPVWVFRTP
jgi:hypothetical protein